MLLFELCLALGVRHPNYLELDAVELADWIAFYRVRPFGEDAADLRMGIATSTNVNMWKKSGATLSKPIDFMPFHRAQNQTSEEMYRVVASVIGA